MDLQVQRCAARFPVDCKSGAVLLDSFWMSSTEAYRPTSRDDALVHRSPKDFSAALVMLHIVVTCRVHEHIMALWTQQNATGNFQPVVDDTALSCKARLPWWGGSPGVNTKPASGVGTAAGADAATGSDSKDVGEGDAVQQGDDGSAAAAAEQPAGAPATSERGTQPESNGSARSDQQAAGNSAVGGTSC